MLIMCVYRLNYVLGLVLVMLLFYPMKMKKFARLIFSVRITIYSRSFIYE